MRVIILVGVVLLLVGLAWVVIAGVRARARASARWRPYRRCSPATGDWAIGIELADDERVFEAHRMFLFLVADAREPAVREQAMLEAEADAFERAMQVNASEGKG